MMSKCSKALAVAVIALVLAVTFASCVGLEADPNSNLPQNAPAEWEMTTFGVPL